MFGLTVNDFVMDEDNCCCFDSDPDLTGVDAGEFCLVGGIGTLWANAWDVGTGCNCATWPEAEEENASIPIVWAYEVDEYGDPCCQPQPCPDECCPSNPCEAPAGPPPMLDEVPDEVRAWLGN